MLRLSIYKELGHPSPDAQVDRLVQVLLSTPMNKLLLINNHAINPSHLSIFTDMIMLLEPIQVSLHSHNGLLLLDAHQVKPDQEPLSIPTSKLQLINNHVIKPNPQNTFMFMTTLLEQTQLHQQVLIQLEEFHIRHSLIFLLKKLLILLTHGHLLPDVLTAKFHQTNGLATIVNISEDTITMEHLVMI